ncbi:hypothetical protein FA15DRAFT_701850 [Coprinopsis marcescibilis]|uniref:HMG box domain-containing protein n=1 Tax=Coprinopsis marcescibilis TaxID=230819 RepID=A0A5C3L371_COPMA|nr:hypothetical protein FA15DRAFT_701850 [Coprinopsis marcescibilis]
MPQFPKSQHCNLEHIPRPCNSFMIFSEYLRKAWKENPQIIPVEYLPLLFNKDGIIVFKQNVVLPLVSSIWKGLSNTEQGLFVDLTREDSWLHALKYPDYQYQPKVNQRSRNTPECLPTTCNVEGEGEPGGVIILCPGICSTNDVQLVTALPQLPATHAVQMERKQVMSRSQLYAMEILQL